MQIRISVNLHEYTIASHRRLKGLSFSLFVGFGLIFQIKSELALLFIKHGTLFERSKK